MKTLIVAAVLAMGLNAQADGFVCETESGLVVKVYNHTEAEEGTRSGAVMIISDSKVGAGNKTIARFTSEKRTLASEELSYTAKVDLRMSDSNRAGELLAGTKLGHVDTIKLRVAFSYANPVDHGDEVDARLTVAKRNGDKTYEDVVCARYLKN